MAVWANIRNNSEKPLTPTQTGNSRICISWSRKRWPCNGAVWRYVVRLWCCKIHYKQLTLLISRCWTNKNSLIIYEKPQYSPKIGVGCHVCWWSHYWTVFYVKRNRVLILNSERNDEMLGWFCWHNCMRLILETWYQHLA